MFYLNMIPYKKKNTSNFLSLDFSNEKSLAIGVK